MPLILQKKEEEYEIGVWRSTETIAELSRPDVVSRADLEACSRFRSETRIREWLTVRNLLYRLDGRDGISISYDERGKPHLSDGRAFSVSHTHEYIAIIIANGRAAGIDIETIDGRILRLSEKFLSGTEKDFVGEEKKIELTHIIWGAKEVLYKIHGKGGLLFRENLAVESFKPGDGRLKARLRLPGTERRFEVQYQKLDNMMLAWAIDNAD
jgi:4'-phosphopantetheinyl transferase